MNIPYVMKRCSKCGRWLVANTVNFHRSKTGKYGLKAICKECTSNKDNTVNTDPSITKVCTTCGREFPATEEYFFRSKTGKYGVRAICKECSDNENRARNNPVNTDPNITQICTTCGREFPATVEYFHKFKRGKYGLKAKCKFCIAEKNFEEDDDYPINTDPSITKVCTKCGRKFPATTEYFHKAKASKYGLTPECKECLSERKKATNNPVNTDPNILQRCTTCGKRLPATTEYFYKSKVGKYGLQNECKECHSRRTWEWRHREELAQRQADLERHRKKMDEEKARKIEARKPLVAEKTCSKCGKTKPASEFHANVRSKDHLASQCKECANAKAREIYYHKLETMTFSKIKK